MIRPKLYFVFVIATLFLLALVPSTHACRPASDEEVRRVNPKAFVNLHMLTNFPGKEFQKRYGTRKISVAFYNRDDQNAHKILFNTESTGTNQLPFLFEFLIGDSTNHAPLYFVAEATDKSCVLFGPVAEMVYIGAYHDLPAPKE